MCPSPSSLSVLISVVADPTVLWDPWQVSFPQQATLSELIPSQVQLSSQLGLFLVHFPQLEFRAEKPVSQQEKPLSQHYTGIKGEAIRMLGANSSKTTFEECLANFKRCLEARGYPKKYIESSLLEVTFDLRQSALKPQKHNTAERLLPFVTS